MLLAAGSSDPVELSLISVYLLSSIFALFTANNDNTVWDSWKIWCQDVTKSAGSTHFTLAVSHILSVDYSQ
jgi:hypothetical protein